MKDLFIYIFMKFNDTWIWRGVKYSSGHLPLHHQRCPEENFILCREVRESYPLYVYIYIFLVILRRFFFAFTPIEYEVFFKRSIWAIDRILTGTITSGVSGPGSNGNEEVLHNPWSSKNWTLTIRCHLVSHTGYLLLRVFYRRVLHPADKKIDVYVVALAFRQIFDKSISVWKKSTLRCYSRYILNKTVSVKHRFKRMKHSPYSLN